MSVLTHRKPLRFASNYPGFACAAALIAVSGALPYFGIRTAAAAAATVPEHPNIVIIYCDGRRLCRRGGLRREGI